MAFPGKLSKLILFIGTLKEIHVYPYIHTARPPSRMEAPQEGTFFFPALFLAVSPPPQWALDMQVSVAGRVSASQSSKLQRGGPTHVSTKGNAE